MRRRKKIRDGLEDINITPVMDVVFLILIYFFVVGSNGFKNQIYKIKLPIASESPAKIGKDKYKSVTFISNNEILIDSNDKKVFTIKLHELDKYLSNKDEVLLSIDKNTEYKNVIEIIDKLKSNGFHWSPSEKAWQRMRGIRVLGIAKAIVL